jgi:voltage-gated potassium channel Kch
MDRGTPALVAWVGAAALVIILIAATLVAAAQIAPDGAPPLGFFESLWASLMRAMDPGTIGGDTGWAFRIVMLAVTLTGIFLVSALIGILTTGVQGRIEALRKGRSFVLERDHTIIFNWSPSIFDVVSELVVANESRRRPRIAIMADRDKVEMEDGLRHKVHERRNTRIICRSGDPTDLHDISIVNPADARAIIILSPDAEDADSQVIKTILALIHDPDRGDTRYRIFAEIREAKNAELARTVGGPEVQLVLADDLIARIIVHSCRQPGLSAVYTELLDFSGCEIYTQHQPELTGMRFGDAVSAFPESSLIGLCRDDGRVWLNPPGDTIVADGMKAVVIAADDSEIRLNGAAASPRAAPALPTAPPVPEESQRTLLLGWNRRGPLVAAELARCVAPGSALLVAADAPGVEEEVKALGVDPNRLAVAFRRTDTSRRAEVEALDPASFDHVLVLGYSDWLAVQAADTRTLVALLHLRAILRKGENSVSIVSEMIDVRNRRLAEVTRVDDFVVSNKLVSLMLAQISENPSLEAVFDDLLDEEGAEICLRPARDYVTVGADVSFAEVVEAAKARGEVAIGHHVGAHEAEAASGVIVNPPKAERRRYGAMDRVIVIAGR